MTDNEIIEALKHYSLKTQALFEAINLIESQRGEIKSLKESVKTALVMIQEAKDLLASDVKTAKSEAIREFAERAKMKCSEIYDEVLPRLFAEILDDVVKEMEG